MATTVAMISDGPDPTERDAVLQFYDLATEERTVPDVPENVPLGHQDPSWRSDGRYLLYVANGRSGSRGAPVVYRWSVADAEAIPITGPGYLEPRYSPDGRYIAATRTSAFGNDVVILEAAHGRELLRITDDGRSWAPVWSPAGDAIAFLHSEGLIVDLQMAMLVGTAPGWTVGETVDLTQVSGLDGGSRPDWYVAPEDLPATPEPTVAPSASGSSDPVTTYLDRLATRSAAVGSVLCVGVDPDPERLPDGFSQRSRRDRAIRDDPRRSHDAVRRGHQAEPRVLRGIRRARAGRPRADPGEGARRISPSWPTRSGVTSARPSRGRRSRCSTSSGPMR